MCSRSIAVSSVNTPDVRSRPPVAASRPWPTCSAKPVGRCLNSPALAGCLRSSRDKGFSEGHAGRAFRTLPGAGAWSKTPLVLIYETSLSRAKREGKLRTPISCSTPNRAWCSKHIIGGMNGCRQGWSDVLANNAN